MQGGSPDPSLLPDALQANVDPKYGEGQDKPPRQGTAAKATRGTIVFHCECPYRQCQSPVSPKAEIPSRKS